LRESACPQELRAAKRAKAKPAPAAGGGLFALLPKPVNEELGGGGFGGGGSAKARAHARLGARLGVPEATQLRMRASHASASRACNATAR
jgi:hypothetical protein